MGSSQVHIEVKADTLYPSANDNGQNILFSLMIDSGRIYSELSSSIMRKAQGTWKPTQFRR